MQLGFVSAILGDLPLEEVLAFAAGEGFGCVELMCWPPGKSDRRYSGVCHIDVNQLGDAEVSRIRNLCERHRVAISGLGYYPNPLDSNAEHREMVVAHLKQVITGAARLGLGVVNTFVGRDHRHAIAYSWDLFRDVWPSIIEHAEKNGIRIGIENCPMLFSQDEWPGGKNLAISPAIWRKMFAEFPSPNLGLNIDPSHLIWLHIDPARCIREFGSKIFHVHAKDTRIDADKIYEHGVLGFGWHTPKIPGMGDVQWGPFFSALTDAGYRGPVCIEVEDRAFEGSLDDRKRALRLSKRFLEPFVG